MEISKVILLSFVGNSGGNEDGNGSDSGSQSEGNGNGGSSSSDNNEDSSKGSSGKSSGGFAESGLKAHNKYRKVHGSPEMKLDEQMSKSAEEYAKKIAQMGALQHSSSSERSDNGENLYMACSSDKTKKVTGEEATKNWSVFYTWHHSADYLLRILTFWGTLVA